jgi:hypothetical protein
VVGLVGRCSAWQAVSEVGTSCDELLAERIEDRAKPEDSTVKSYAEKGESSGQSAAEWADSVERELPPVPLRPLQPEFDAVRCANAGLWQGALAGCTSLLFNIVGSVLWPAVTGQEQHPLRLIQVFLTFPLGDAALQLSSGLLLAIGCLMYLATGMLYGMLFVLGLAYFLPHAGTSTRLVACSFWALALWVVNFYGILSWLQPLAFGGQWIFTLVPWWVAALTHLVFGWTIAFIYPLGTQPKVETQRG